MNISMYSKFRFSCHKGIECFTKCCRDVNIFLTPYDIVRMKNRLGISSGEFLEKYTKTLIKDSYSLPVVLLKMSEQGDKPCLFLTSEGCSIYEDRPWSCRLYPLDRDPNEEDEFKLIVGEDFCYGLKESKEWILEDWLEDQGFIAYDNMNIMFEQITKTEADWKDKVPDKSIIDMFYMTCYDIDRFRKFIFETKFLKVFDIDQATVERIRTDDKELLKFGFKWLKFGLLGERTIAIKKEVINATKK
jgi:Fe-S-cluster containining protein